MGNSENKILIRQFSIINNQRWLIEEKLSELGLKPNWELQDLYIKDAIRKKHINILKKYKN